MFWLKAERCSFSGELIKGNLLNGLLSRKSDMYEILLKQIENQIVDFRSNILITIFFFFFKLRFTATSGVIFIKQIKNPIDISS